MDRFQSKLFDRINYERQVKNGTEHFKLNSLLALLRRLDQPHIKYPVVHVAGTKGKGSTATMLGSILSATGRKTGVYTSPHLETIRQRIAIDSRWIPNDDLETILADLDPHITAMDREIEANLAELEADKETLPGTDGDDTTDSNEMRLTKPLTFFEIITAAAMHYFAREKCEAVVLEVGLGGRLDSTNVCQPEACVITNISIDHTRQLGSTVDKIAFEKAGIIKPGVPVVSGTKDPTAAQVIANIAEQNNANLQLLDRDFRIEDQAVIGSNQPHHSPLLAVNRAFRWLSDNKTVDQLGLRLLGRHQQTNAALAVAVTQILNSKDWAISDDAIRHGLASATLAGRTEIVSDRPSVILDIAHNVASVEAMVGTLQDQLSRWNDYRCKRIIFATSRDKDCREMLKQILPCFDEVIITEYLLNPRATKSKVAYELALEVRNKSTAQTTPLSHKQIIRQQTPAKAWDYVRESMTDDDLLCVAGSAFLIAELGNVLRQWAADKLVTQK